MINKHKSITLKLIILSLLINPIINHSLILRVYADSNYTIALEKGTQILEVKRYDEQTWKNTINITSIPSDWFGGDADKIGAKSKTTLLEWSKNDFNTYLMFVNLVVPHNSLSIFSNVSNYGYNSSYINNNYPNYYKIWEYRFNYWTFTTKEFSDSPDYFYELSFILQEAPNFSTLLSDYNDFAGKVNNDTTLQLLGYSIPILNGDDLLWQFIVGKFAVAKPIKEYLTTFTEIVGCKNVTIQDNTLIFQRRGERNYNIKVTYNTLGLIDCFVVMNSEGYIFYEIRSFYPKIIFYIILGIIAIFVFGIALLIAHKKIKLYKQFK